MLPVARAAAAEPQPAPGPPLVHEVLSRRLSARSKAPVAVAYSGGGDSLALLLAAHAWAKSAGRPVLALTVDHGLQPQSRDWTRMAEAVAARLGAGFRALEWSGPKPSSGLSAAARRARHALLAEAAREAGAQALLLGHTRDDVLESELMREQGSTLGTLREWSPSPVWPEGRGVFLLRPLLSIRRAELRLWLADKGFSWIEDPANDDQRSARARARRSLRLTSVQPWKGGELNAPTEASPGRDPGLRHRADERELRPLAQGTRADPYGVIRIGRAALASAQEDAARRLLALACVCAGGGERAPPRSGQVQRLWARIAAGEDFTACLAGARVQAGEAIEIMRDAGEAERAGLGRLALEPGVAAVWDGRFELIAEDRAIVVPLRGQMSRLHPQERAALRLASINARPALPAVRSNEEGVTCPILAQGSQVRARCLVGERFSAACGMIVAEDETD